MLNAAEHRAVAAFRRGDTTQSDSPQTRDHSAWLDFGLRTLLATGSRIRGMRFAPLSSTVVFKSDGSPSVPQEQAIESYLRTQLAAWAPHATMMGEESGGTISDRGFSVAIDPVDGTWALVNRSATHATSLAFFEDGRSFLGMVANPATGEIAYGLRGQRSRLLQLSCHGEDDCGYDLPLDRSPDESPLINLHPARSAQVLSARLHQAWEERKIGMLKAMGGSPAWALLEAAKGSFIYVNQWSGRAPEPFDLAGSILLLRQAGGDAVGLNGKPIDEYQHRGLFAAGTDLAALTTVVALCRG